ncbi:hypothetical protein IWQ61_000388 [Dispira simplex]|nr:hypothetical protein IWQ61_000388 [Dispira simplex]
MSDTPPPNPSKGNPVCTAYIIDNAVLKLASKKPRHLAVRWQQRHGNGSHAECTRTAEPTRAQRNHQAFVEARRAKAEEALCRVAQVRARKADRDYQQALQCQATLTENLRDAQAKRRQLLQTQAQQCGDVVRHAKTVASQQAVRQLAQAVARRERIEARLQHGTMRRQRLLRLSSLLKISPRSDGEGTTSGDSGGSGGEWDAGSGRVSVQSGNVQGQVHRWSLRARPRSTPHVLHSVLAIQRLFRRRQLTRAYTAFAKFDVNPSRVRSGGPERALEAILSPSVIQAADQLMHTILYSIPLTEHEEEAAIVDTLLGDPVLPHVLRRARGYKNSGRFVLMGTVLSIFPREIMSSTDRPEDRLLASLAEAMTQSLEALGQRLHNPGGSQDWYPVVATFIHRWDTFYRNFLVWKRRDTRNMLGTLIAHYIELDRLWHSVSVDANARSTWKPPILEQREAIRVEIRRFGGQAALDQLQEALQTARSGYPGPVSSPTQSESHSGASDTVFSSRTSQSDGAIATLGSTPEDVITVDDDIVGDWESHPRTGSSSSSVSPGLPASVMDYIQTEQLAHEIVVNPFYELGASRADKMLGVVRSITQLAYFDRLRELFANAKEERTDESVPTLVQCVLDLLNDYRQLLLPLSGSTRDQVEAHLDIILVGNQLRLPGGLDMFDFGTYFDGLLNLLAKLCAPVRDSEIQAIRQLDEPFTQAQRILALLQAMRLDHLNYHIRKLRPLLRTHAVTYERSRFARALANGQLTLDGTRRWLARAIPQSDDGTSPSPVMGQSRFLHWYYDAVTTLVFSTRAIQTDQCPETLLLDLERLFSIQNELQALTIVAALLILTKNLASPTSRQHWLQEPVLNVSSGTQGNLQDPSPPSSVHPLTSLKDRLLTLLRHEDTNVEHLVVELQRFLKSCQDRHSLGEDQATVVSPPSPAIALGTVGKDVVRTMVRKTLSYRDPVYNILSRHLQTLLKTWLLFPGHYAKPWGNGSFSVASANQRPSSAGSRSLTVGDVQLLRSYGLETVEQEMRTAFARIRALFEHNRKVYSKYYDEIFRELI